MSDKLKPCPFCGSDDLAIQEDIEDIYVVCNDCHVQGSPVHDDELEKKAIEKWNNRTP